jgi:para-nitrobenzyl esterase
VPGLVVSDADRFEMMQRFNPEAGATLSIEDIIHAAYLPVTAPGTGFNARTDLLNRFFFLPSRDNVLNALKSQQDNVWYCQFNWDKEPAPWNEVYGAAHAFELPFVFGNFAPSLFSNVIGGKANEGGRLALSSAMMQCVAAFAHSGNPNHPFLGVSWPTWPGTLMLDATLTEKSVSVQ